MRIPAELARRVEVPRLLALQRLRHLPRDLALGMIGYRLRASFYGLGIGRVPGGKRRGNAGAQPRATLTDPWPGHAAKGQTILGEGRILLAGRSRSLPRPLAPALNLTPAEAAELHSFEWLRDLRAHGGDQSRRAAREMTADWIGSQPRWDPLIWDPVTTGRRLANWIGCFEFFAASGDVSFRQTLMSEIVAGARYLARVLPAGLAGSQLVAAAKGLALAGAAVPGGEVYLERGLDLIHEALARALGADGGLAERSPSRHLAVLRDLIDLRAALAALERECPSGLQLAIAQMAPLLKMLQHGDGGLALFNGSNEEAGWLVDVVLQRADGRGRALMSAPQTGFQRLQSGRSVVIVDGGSPPAPGFDASAHAGMLAFEFSIGKERLIVNMGAHPGDPEWQRMQRFTAAHSTLTLADTNSASLAPYGCARRPENMECRREEADGNIWLDLSHDGYLPNLRAVHHRRLYLAANGEDFRGEDKLVGGEGRAFTIRFHLHPDVQASMSQGGNTAILRLPKGEGWRMRAGDCEMRLEQSVYLGVRGEVKRSLQLVLETTAKGPETTVKWALQRDSKK